MTVLRRATTCCLLLVASLVPTAPEAAPKASVQVSLDRTEVPMGGRLRYTVEAAVQGSDSISLERQPSFGSAFRVVGRTRSPQFVIRNGRARRSVTIGYRLRAAEPGEHTIEPPVVRIGSRRFEAEPRQVTVTDRSSGSRGRQRRGSGGQRGGSGTRQRDDLFLAGRLEPTREPFVGQQLVLSYYLYKTPHKFDIEPRPPEEPSLDDFWIEGLSREFAGHRRMVNARGGLMERTTMRVYALFPLTTGEVTIEPMRVDVVSGGFFSNRSKLTLESEPIELDVQPLPSGAPDGFEPGNIGDWQFSAEIDRLSSSVGRAVTLTLEARGDGNLRRLTLPDVSGQLDGFAVTSRESETEKQIRGRELWGRKTVEYTLLPTRRGTVEIPSLTFAYFSPADEAYHTDRSQSFELEIRGGKLSPQQRARLDRKDDSTSDSTSSSDDETASEALRKRLHGPIATSDSSVRGSLPLSLDASLYWWLVGGTGMGLLALLLGPGLWSRLRDRVSSDSTQGARTRAEARLEGAREASAADAPEEVLRALKGYLTETLDCPGGEWTKPELRAWLQEAEVPDETIETSLELLEWCHEARFAPAAALDETELERAIEQCRDLVEQLESARDAGTIHPIGTAMVAGLAGLMAVGCPTAVEAQENGSFGERVDRAITAEDAGRWDEALGLWSSLVESHPSHAVLQYNYGTALLQRGDLGRGRLALERAVLSEARLTRARHNLDIARQLVQRRRIEMARGETSIPAPPTTLQWWDRATHLPPPWSSWGVLIGLWLACLGAVGRIVLEKRGRHVATVGAAIALVVALVAGGLWWGRSACLDDATPAVVTADEATLREGPSEHAARRDAELPIVAGVRLDLLERREDWSKVRVSETRTGWVRTETLTQVVPPRPST